MHKTLPIALLFSVGVLFSCSLYAADVAPAEDFDWQQECQRVKNLQLPKEDMPSRVVLDSVQGCSADQLYFAAQGDSNAKQGNWDRVRACAIVTNANAVVMMLYANGYGVKVNYDLAINYACKLGAIQSDYAVDDLIYDLAELSVTGVKPDKPIELSYYATSGLALKFADAEEWRKRELERMRSLDDISRSWSKAHKTAFAKLRQAAEDFAQTSSRNEADQVGTGRAEFINGIYEKVKSDFVQDVERGEKGEFPSYSQADFAELDNKLNKAYLAIMHPGPEDKQPYEISTGITPEGIKEAQRAWLKYRDAWVAFGKVRYPAVPAHAWKVMLTERRIKQLEDLKDMVDRTGVQ
ncbi:MAG TPA: lysozyme inhibitor LprI family protein [Gallionellaceae bacterium]